MIFIIISEELNLSICLSLSTLFFKVIYVIYYTHIYRITHFDWSGRSRY